jgi:hypothetical protein
LTKNNNLKYITLIYLKRSANAFLWFTHGEYNPGEDRRNRNYEASQLLTRYDTLSSYDFNSCDNFFLLPFFLKK